ncbi:hypothetical protein [Vibrio hippocampi]|uniref:Chromosome partitioning protein ParA n=1 Tax=Vibrio hippocampi TaxID=654686 RepID=A0ABM8ZER2_9VIBR|nr:hypothetical protein [Vibrio hippocampi]CAH0524887.1 hypothetical protein VHP8226_00562 [Vibrio hippocampi]
MKTVNKVGLIGLAIALAGCGNDVEFKSHSDKDFDFSNYEGALIDAKKIKGTFLDRDYVEGIVSQINSAQDAISSRGFLRNTPEPVKVLDQHIANLSSITDIDTAPLVARLGQYKSNIEQYLLAEEQRKKLTIERLEKDLKPLFADLDAKTAQLTEYKAFLQQDTDDYKAKKAAVKAQEALVKQLDAKTEQAIDQYIIDKEIPISVDSVGLSVDFSNAQRFRDGQTCSEDRKVKADYRATLMTTSSGETACIYDFEYKLSYSKYRVSFDANTKADLEAIIAKAEAADKEQYIKLGYLERMYYKADDALSQKKTIATNKYGRSLQSTENAVNSIKREIGRYPEGLINEDRTLNLESPAFAKTMRYTRGVKSVRIDTDTRIFRDYNQVSDRLYSQKIKQQLAQSLVRFEVDEAGFDLPDGIAQNEIAYLYITSQEPIQGQQPGYLWHGSSLAKTEGELRLNDRFSEYFSNSDSILDRIQRDIL